MLSKTPLVSIICLCYNHAAYVATCLNSVFNCGYPNLELIIVDDASTDLSVQIINSVLEQQKGINHIKAIQKIFLSTNHGNCRAFNIGLASSTGKYVLDLATDDVLLEGGLQYQVACMENAAATPGFCYANALFINEKGDELGLFTEAKGLNHPSGHIYTQIIAGNFICPPTVLFNTTLLKEEGGYDENLTFEDLDIWLRLSRKHPVVVSNAVVIKWRRHQHSLSFQKYRANASKHLVSVQLLLQKLNQLNQNHADWQATAKLCAYYMRFAVYTNNKNAARQLFKYLKLRRLDKPVDRIIHILIPFASVVAICYRLLLKYRQELRY